MSLSHEGGPRTGSVRTAVLALAFAGLVTGLMGCGDGSRYGSSPAMRRGDGAMRETAPDAPNSYDKMKQEQYSHFVDNPFKTVAQDPVSTFSADVNTASYSNVRRMLNAGRLPPPDAVRIADLVNYFPYTYPRPSGQDPVAFTIDLASCPWEPTHHLVRVGMKARELTREETPARNLVFLVDVSGSMGANSRLPMIKKSLNMLIDQLAPQDTVSIVTYAAGSTVKLPPTSGSQKSRIREVVDALRAGGSTNGEGGIRLAYDQARASFVVGGANRVILCTDGDFNVGITSEGELVRLIEQQRQGHVFLTVLGYGMGNLKNATLEKLANHGNGHYAYIDSESEAHKVFVEQGAALVAVAKDVKLQVEFNPQRVQAYRLIGYENRVLNTEDFKDDGKDAGDLGSGHTVTAFYQVVPVGVPFTAPGVDPLKYQQPTAGPTAVAATGEWLTVKMRYKHPESSTSLELAKPLAGDALGRPVSADFRFAAAVAEFGLLLRDSPYKGQANYDRVLMSAEANLGADTAGHRTEFTALVRKARQHDKSRREEPGQ